MAGQGKRLKRTVLKLLPRDLLLALLDAFELEVADRGKHGDVVAAIEASGEVGIDDILAPLSRDQLKDICSALGLDEGFTRDATNVGHCGTGGLEITIRAQADVEKARPLLVQSYEVS